MGKEAGRGTMSLRGMQRERRLLSYARSRLRNLRVLVGTKGDGCAVRDVVRGRARGDSIGRGQSPYPMILPEGRMDSQRHGASPNPYFLGIALWSTFGIMYVTGKCPGASFTISALEVKHRTA